MKKLCILLICISLFPFISSFGTLIDPTSSYVPYSGATGNISVGIYNLTSGGLFPTTTLLYDIGTGANRWRWLYVQNISAEYVDISGNLNILGNITSPWGNFTELFTGGINISNISHLYVPYTGAINNVDLGTNTLTTSCVAMDGISLSLGQCGANARINITSAGNMYGIGPWDNDDTITASSGLIVRRSRALPYFLTLINDLGLTVYDNSASNNIMINLTTAGNYIGVGNVTGDWGFFNNLIVDGNLTGSLIYGEAWYHNHTATELNFAVDGLYYNLTFSNSLVNGMTFNDAGDYLEIDIAGVYKVNYIGSGDGQNNHAYFTSVTINGVVQDKCESHKKMSAGADVVTMTGSCLLELNIDDKVRLATADVGATGIGNYYSSELNLVRIGN